MTFTETEQEENEFTGDIYIPSIVIAADRPDLVEAPPSLEDEMRSGDETDYGFSGGFIPREAIRPLAARNLARESRPDDSWARSYHFGQSMTMEQTGNQFVNWLTQSGILRGAGFQTMATASDGQTRQLTLEESLARAAGSYGQSGLMTPAQTAERPSLNTFGEEEWADMKARLLTNWDTDPTLKKLVEEHLVTEVPNVGDLIGTLSNAQTAEEENAAVAALEMAGLIDSNGRFLAPTEREMQARLDNRVIPGVIDDFVEDLRSRSGMALIGTTERLLESDITEAESEGWVVSYDGSPYEVKSVHELFGYGNFGPGDAFAYINKLASGEVVGGPAVAATLQKELYALGYLDSPSGRISDGDVRNALASALGHLQIDLLNMASATNEFNPDVLRSNIIGDHIGEITARRQEVVAGISEETKGRIETNVIRRMREMGYNPEDMSLGGEEKLAAAINSAVMEAQDEGIPGINDSDTRLAEMLLKDFYQTESSGDGLVDSWGLQDSSKTGAWTDNISWMDRDTDAAFLHAAFSSGALTAERENELNNLSVGKWRNSLTPDELRSVAVSNLVNSFTGGARDMSEDDIANALTEFAGLMGSKWMQTQNYSTQDFSLMAQNASQTLQTEVPGQNVAGATEGILSSMGVQDLGNPSMSAALDAIRGKISSRAGVRRSRVQNV